MNLINLFFSVSMWQVWWHMLTWWLLYFRSHNTPMVLYSSFPFPKEGDWSSETWGNFPRVTQQVCGPDSMQTKGCLPTATACDDRSEKGPCMDVRWSQLRKEWVLDSNQSATQLQFFSSLSSTDGSKCAQFIFGKVRLITIIYMNC